MDDFFDAHKEKTEILAAKLLQENEEYQEQLASGNEAIIAVTLSLMASEIKSEIMTVKLQSPSRPTAIYAGIGLIGILCMLGAFGAAVYQFYHGNMEIGIILVFLGIGLIFLNRFVSKKYDFSVD
jgi:hypothetical protein